MRVAMFSFSPEQSIVRTEKAKRPIQQYSVETLNAALASIRNGLPIRVASRQYGVPRGTLQDRINGRAKRRQLDEFSGMGAKKHKKHKSERRDRYDDERFDLHDDSSQDFPSEKPSGLRLILKVGGSSTPEQAESPPHIMQFQAPPPIPNENLLHRNEHIPEKHKKSKKKKKKKDRKHKHHHKDKHRRHQENLDVFDETPVKKTRHLTPPAQRISAGPPSPDRPQRSCVLKQRQERRPLQMLLDHLLYLLEKRDPNQFFSFPVTDQIAPGYSSIINRPMDFSTMKLKIDDNLYKTLKEFRRDFETVCDNAMTYNRQDTIYYKSAKKLLYLGNKLLSPERIKCHRNDLPSLREVHPNELGFIIEPGYYYEPPPPDRESSDNEAPVSEDERKKRKSRKYEAYEDNLTAEEIIAQTEAAAKSAKRKLARKRPNSKMGFLRMKSDGTTTLAIVNPDKGCGNEEKKVSLSMLTGKLSHGTASLPLFKEDRRNIAKTVKPLYYGPFGSYAPSYDSTFANLSKDESDLVLTTYGDDSGAQYAESILNFARDADYTLNMADELLDRLTGGEHRKTKAYLQERKALREEEERIMQMLEENGKQPQTDSHIKDLQSLRTLSDLGIDVSFLDSFDSKPPLDQSQLDNTSQMLSKLEHVQNQRLSAPPPQHLSALPQPSQLEHNLVEKIQTNLTEMSKMVPPSAIVEQAAVRKALGVMPSNDIECQLRELFGGGQLEDILQCSPTS